MFALPLSAGATVVACGAEFVYEQRSTGSHEGNFGDYYDEKVSIDFDFPLAREITISTNDPYVLVKVELDVDGDGHAGYFDYIDEFPGEFNPSPGDRIDNARVTVKKDCPDVCPNIDGNQYEVPEGYILEEGQCVLPPPPVDVCPNLEGNQEIVPEGYILEEGECVLPPPPPVDLCPEEGIQTELPCAEPPAPVDVCPNDEGIQTEVPCPSDTPPPPPSALAPIEVHRTPSGGIVWCTATRTEWCRQPEGFGGSVSWLEQQILNLMQQLIDQLKVEIELLAMSL